MGRPLLFPEALPGLARPHPRVQDRLSSFLDELDPPKRGRSVLMAEQRNLLQTAYGQANTSSIIKPLNGIVTGIGAGSVALCRFIPELTYQDIIIRCTIAGVPATRAQLETMLTTARFTVSGTEKFSVQVKDLIAIAEFYRTGLIGDSGYLVIPFNRLWMEGAAAQLDPNYGTANETSVILELTQAGGSTIDGITAFARCNPVAQPLGKHIFLRRFTFNVAATGLFLYPDITRIPGERLYAIHLVLPTPANLVNFAMIMDDTRQIDVPPSLLTQLYQECSPVRTPQTAKGYVHIDFASLGFDNQSLPIGLANSAVMELNIANAAPNAVTAICEYGMDALPKAA